ncbi:Stk1 family PASTA domain-containing Ser/Thr kinase [Anoxybacillus sp. LAT_35]|uniref:Stk1 family PASTA domain-containing Ser/Thr kinase n=1 Tax=unclassified Anoxybacillus TaxID=2639704 RepID=UPI001EDAEEE7|nr:Stk1 family PASTA domain-containing Ser/Thr kinase [Anoxybacillus sp. LAT27]MCG5026129.1 Stk1 family PASTA domain-containing Ser/Thr kinase [Anoxybacillus flavithermus]MCG6172484.1 Stk1 family PASTA domain-containing Ser/Thr kinase [Anoxybacillus sp. LAT_11]MCG6175220.1 Stk1 family PASTA domain-containing Ser/Thr kinase [Anoxybacillus sp. LAT_31]MCG6177986.1 Stk1 family PASTA domain-containing Ser/Thr kinase [Anoxybacillus sp. LAT_35]MCG6180786.1 Stk1 family PASTA domain-containing Ser/Thr 
MLIGKRLNDRYKLLQLIGGGGMANVYLARDIILDRDVAVKVLRLDFVNDELFIKRFRREAQAATSLNHENIVTIYDVGEDDGIYYMVMEYVRGCTLKQYIQQHAPLPVQEALRMMDQLTGAIAHAHQNGVIHRDIKPQNILVAEDGTLKITDFGIAVALSSTTITQTNSVLGSVHYLSPEQAKGGMATEKSDIYSLGIVMFELLTGQLPFSGESAVAIVLKHLQTETPSVRRWNPNIPQSVENIVLKATAKNPLHRYNSALDMRQHIRTALSPERINEAKFTLPIEDDDEETKVVPIIKSSSPSLEKRENVPAPKEKRSKKWIALWALFLLLFIGAGVSAVTWLPDLFFPKDVAVPDVTNKHYDDAIAELTSLGLKIEETIEQEHDDIAEGFVIRTNPQAGKVVKAGTAVTIYKSIGKKKVAFKNYVGEQIADVEPQLRSEKYLLIDKKEVYSDEPAGTIIEQFPLPGEKVVPEETEVRFTVSLGREKIILKDLTGYTEKSVRDYAADQQLYVIVKQQYSDTVEKGLVISQTPQANAKLEKGATVTVVISLGKEPVQTKKVIQDIDIPYEPPVDVNEPVMAELYIEDENHSFAQPYKRYRLTNDVKERVEFVIQQGKQGKYRVVVNGTTVREGIVPYPTTP